jgi:hypothetical protein
MCAVDTIDLACVESFKASNCFPYCMALHVRGSATQPMIVHGASEWGEGVTMLRRDCGLFDLSDPTSSSSTVSVSSSTVTAGAGATTVLLPSSPYGLNARTAAASNCTYNPRVISVRPRATTGAYESYGSISLDTQPFAFAGDLALVARHGVADLAGNPTWFIEVHRLFGNQQNEFTLIPLAQEIPSSGPCTTPADCGSNILASCSGVTGCLPAIPYSWDSHPRAHVPGTVSERYAFYITNPSLEPFTAFSYYCANARSGGQYATNEFQISAISSYGGVRLWRINPYLYCPIDPYTGRHLCPVSGTAGTVQIEALNFSSSTLFSVAMCTQEFVVMAVGLDYVNEDNLALTVMRTTLDNINTMTLEPLDASRATYPILWVNPDTLAWREDRLWMPEASSPALTQGQLCPSQRRTPNVGSILAESLVSMAVLVRLPLNIVMGMPVVMSLIDDNCPALSRGHYMLQSCGAELLSLDDFFHAIYRANALFFQGFAIVADGFGPGYPQTFINGVAMASENGPYTPILPGFAAQLAKIGNVNPMQAVEMLQNTIANLPGPVQYAKQAMHQPLARAQFLYTTLARMLMRMLQAIKGGRTIGNLFWSTMADSVPDFEAMVTTRMRQVCGGVSLMAGYTNPLAILTDRWCGAYVSLEEGLLTMLTVFTVDVPLFACVCKGSAGSNFAEYVLGSCYPDAPDAYKPLLVELLARYDPPTAICPALVAMAQLHFTRAMDQTFSDINAGTDQLASVIDYLIVSVDSGAGNCENFQDNPYVLALIPQPVDYFRVCGLTSFCRSRCLAEFEAFESVSALMQPASSETVVETIQSPLFASLDADARNPFTATLALMELANCTAICGTVRSALGASDRCFLVAGADSSAGLVVAGFCAPIDATAGVRRGGSVTLDSSAILDLGTVTQAEFVWRPDLAVDFWSAYKLILMTTEAVYQCHKDPASQVQTCARLYALADLGADVTKLTGIATLGNTLIQQTRALDPGSALPYATKARFYAYTLVEIYGFVLLLLLSLLSPQPQRALSHNTIRSDAHTASKSRSSYDCWMVSRAARSVGDMLRSRATVATMRLCSSAPRFPGADDASASSTRPSTASLSSSKFGLDWPWREVSKSASSLSISYETWKIKISAT